MTRFEQIKLAAKLLHWDWTLITDPSSSKPASTNFVCSIDGATLYFDGAGVFIRATGNITAMITAIKDLDTTLTQTIPKHFN
jgi:hypothetical protein